ncbi:MAG: hypothetical protein ACRD3Q_15320 [Terriglobales bacterium]
MPKNVDRDERSPERKRDARPNANLHDKDQQPIEDSIAGEAGDTQDLSPVEDVNEESVQELAASGQAMEAAAIEGVEDAADHPERPVHTHEEYGRPDDVPPERKDDAA